MAELAVQTQDRSPEILSVIRGHDSPAVKTYKLSDFHGSDLAKAVLELSDNEKIELFRVCTPDLLAELMEFPEPEQAAAYLAVMPVKKAARVVEALETDTAMQALRHVPKERRLGIIAALDDETQRDLRLIASFDEDQIGSRMTTNFILLQESMTLHDALEALAEQAPDVDNLSTLFVSDAHGTFCGAVSLRELLISAEEHTVSDLVMTSFPYVYAAESIDACIDKIKDYAESVLPVLDGAGAPVGVITTQSVLEVVDASLSEDYAMLGGLSAETDLKETLFQSMRKRLPWLFILLALGMLVSTVIGVFEQVIRQLTIIMAFQSLILDMSGNVGTQSLAVTIRVLTDETLTFRKKLRLLVKEMRVGLFNGLLLAGISFILVGLYIIFIQKRAPLFSFAVSGCISVSLVLAMLISSAVGTVVPMLFKKLKIDPAVASGPLITTMNDLVAVVTYYGMSWLLLIQTLHLHESPL